MEVKTTDFVALFKEEILEILKTYEYPINWFVNSTKDEVVQIISVIKSTFSFDEEEEEYFPLKYNGIEIISNRLTYALLAFLNDGDITRAETLLENARNLVDIANQKNYIHLGYLKGILYVIHGIDSYMKVQSLLSQYEPHEKRSLLKELSRLLIQLEEYDQLETQTKVGALAVKHYFNKQRRRTIEHAQTLDKMIELDPFYFEWYYCYFIVLRYDRRQSEDRIASQKEQNMIEKAYSLASDNPFVAISLVTLYTEFIKNRTSIKNKEHSILAEYKRFQTDEQLIEFIIQKSREALDKEPKSVRVNIAIAELFSSLLPAKYKDLEYAEQLINKALELSPMSSKANHRMGILLLNKAQLLKRMDEVYEACQYFKKAYDVDGRNFPALMQLIYSQFQPSTFSSVLDMINKELGNEIWKTYQITQLLFAKGTLMLMKTCNTKDVIVPWCVAYKTDSNEMLKQVKSLSYYSWKYKWSTSGLLLLRRLHELLTEAETSISEQSEDKMIIGSILEAVNQSLHDAKLKTGYLVRPNNVPEYPSTSWRHRD